MCPRVSTTAPWAFPGEKQTCSPMRYLFLLASVNSSPLFLVPSLAASLSARSTPVSAPGRMAIIGWGRSTRDCHAKAGQGGGVDTSTTNCYIHRGAKTKRRKQGEQTTLRHLPRRGEVGGDGILAGSTPSQIHGDGPQVVLQGGRRCRCRASPERRYYHSHMRRKVARDWLTEH